MSGIIFYEKPGCVGNRKQKVKLLSLGYQLDVRNLLTEPWTANKLRSYFGQTAVTEWFNLSAPAVSSGEIDIDVLDEQEAIAMMITNPLLIRRPLLEFEKTRQSGFVSGPVLNKLGISLSAEEDLQSCPMSDADPVCEVLS